MMSPQYITNMCSKSGYFKTTIWAQIINTQDNNDEVKLGALNSLIQRYWKPVYCYVRSKGHKNERAKDLTQGFFTKWLDKNYFGKANHKKGRFRDYLLSSLENYLHNEWRDEHAKKRYPSKGIVSIEDLVADHDISFDPADKNTPEKCFERMWLMELLERVLKNFEKECIEKDNTVHYELFLRCILEPALYKSKMLSREKLSEIYGLSKKNISNRLITARRAYQRLLRDEIRKYAFSKEDERTEIGDLFAFLST